MQVASQLILLRIARATELAKEIPWLTERFFGISRSALSCVVPTTGAFAQEPFYKGKTVRIIVGGSAGGGYDTYTRTIARHLGKHVPGNPTFVVENMTGAGSLIAANHVYQVARPDGLTIGHFIGGLILQHVLGKPGIEFDGQEVRALRRAGSRHHHRRHQQSERHHKHRSIGFRPKRPSNSAASARAPPPMTSRKSCAPRWACRFNSYRVIKGRPISNWRSTAANYRAWSIRGSRSNRAG